MNDTPVASYDAEAAAERAAIMAEGMTEAERILAYSWGRDAVDAYPKQRTAKSFAAFAKYVCDHRAEKRGEFYFCAPFVKHDGKHHRCKDDAAPRRFLPLDLDYIPNGEALADLLLALQPYRHFAYTTASHTAELPRLRVVLELSRTVDRDEGVRIGLAFQARLIAAGAGEIKFDQSVYRAEQACFGPLTGAEIYPRDRRMSGAVLDVDELLASAPSIEPTVTAAERAERIAHDDPRVEHLYRNSYVLEAKTSAGKLPIRCPNAAAHSHETGPTATVVLLPHFNGVAHAKIKCLHDSCASVTQEEFWRLAGYVEPGKRANGADVHGHPGDNRGEDADEDPDAQLGEAPVDEVSGAELLDIVHDFLQTFVAYPSTDAAIAHTLWIAHAHLMDAWESTPRIAFLSPEPGSGKTRALEITETLVPNPVEAINATPAYMFRKVSDPAGLPTILYDEVDTLFGPRAKDNEEIRGILNAGHRRGAMAGRCVVHGKTVKTEELPAYCAVALAGLGNLPDTILSRSVVVRMRRRAPTESIEPYRRRVHAPIGNGIRDRLATWARTVVRYAGAHLPPMPDGLQDRNADVWEALLAVADAAGGDWPHRARVSAVSLVSLAMAASPSLGVRLLADLREIFGSHEAMTSKGLLGKLVEVEEGPWGDLKGKPIDARRLAGLLRQYGVESRQVRVGDVTAKGYRAEDLHDAWRRYLGEATKGKETWETNETKTAEPTDLDLD